MKWPLAENSWGQEEEGAVLAVVRSGRLTMGARVQELERAIADLHGRRYALMVNSGSSANLLAVAALQARGWLRAGDEVIVPAVAWATTYAPLMQHGLKLRVADCGHDLNADPYEMEQLITERTRMVVAVSVLGNPAALEEIRGMVMKRGLLMMEDNCESFMVPAAGGVCGSFGVISTLSSFFSHHLNTVEGGFLLTDDKELHELALCLRAHGWTRDLPKDHAWRAGETPGEYRFILPGYNLRPTEIAAAVGLVQLKKLDLANAQRRLNWARFREAFEGHPRLTLVDFKSGAIPFGFVLLALNGAKRREVTALLLKNGIESRMVTGGSITMHALGSKITESCPIAESVHERGFFVGNHPFDLKEQIAAMRAVLSQW